MAVEGEAVLLDMRLREGFGEVPRGTSEARPFVGAEGQDGLAIYGHVAQKDAEAVKSAVEGWLKKLGKLK